MIIDQRGAWVRTTPNDDGGLMLNTPNGWVTEQEGSVYYTAPDDGSGRNPRWWISSDTTGTPLMGGTGGSVLPALGRAISLISEPIGAMPVRVVDVDAQHTLPLPRWLDDPMLARPDARFGDAKQTRRSRDLTRSEYNSQIIATAVLRGNAFAIFARGYDGEPMAGTFRLINPALVTPGENMGEYNVNGTETRGGVLPIGGGAEVMHFRGQPPYDENGWGYGVLDRYAMALGLAHGVRKFAAGQMVNGVPPGYLKVTNPNLTEPQANDLKAKWMSTYGGSARSIAVLNATTDFQAVNLTPVDAQMIDMMKMSLLDVALACGVEPSMLGVSADSNTYANVESRQIQFQTFTLLPHVSRMEDTLSAYLPQGTRVDVIMRALMRADTQTRIDGYAQALRDGWMNVNEVRVLEGLEPVEGGDEYAFQKAKREAELKAKEAAAATVIEAAGASQQMADNKGGVSTIGTGPQIKRTNALANPRNSNPEKVA